MFDEDEKPQSENILEIMSSLQDEINSLKNEKEKLATALNKYRLMTFPEDIVNVHDNAQVLQFSLFELVKKDPTLELASLWHKNHLMFCAEISDFIEEHKKLIVKTKKNKDAHKTSMESVELERKLPKTVSGRIKLSQLDKALDGMRKTFHMLSQSDLVKAIQGTPMYKDVPEVEIRASLEKLFAKDAAKGVTK